MRGLSVLITDNRMVQVPHFREGQMTTFSICVCVFLDFFFLLVVFIQVQPYYVVASFVFKLWNRKWFILHLYVHMG